MAVYLNTNLASLNAQRHLNVAQGGLASSIQRLSSGLRINSAKDDPAGLAIASRMSARIRGMNLGARNANDGISLLQTTEGAMSSITGNLQRMRELSLQAANGSNSGADRQSINFEIQQLLADIQYVATNTRFNGIRLLDGSFNAQSFMLGANPGDAINIRSIAGMQTSQLGSTGTAFQTTLSGGLVSAALSAGDLSINGTAVGASKNGAAPGQDASSAHSIAAAINAVAADSGATATANPTLLTSAAATSFTDIAAGTFSINGASIGGVGAGGDAASQGANLAAAISAAAGASGVTALADASGAVTLTATDGRNIEIDFNGPGGAAANAAEAASNRNAFLTQTGFASAAVGTQAVAAIAAQNTIQMKGALALSDVGRNIVINGVTFTVANAAAPPAFVDASHITLNVDISGGTSASASAAALADAVALAQGQGLLATLNLGYGGDTVTLDDVTPGASATTITTSIGKAALAHPVAGVAAVGATTAVSRGSIKLVASGENGITIDGGGNAGLSSGLTVAVAVAKVFGINALDVLTEAHAQNAVVSIDSAIDMVGASRAQLGAYQNRFALALANLQNASENLGMARSRIEDTDFAAETSTEIRAQILQQAASAMLVQANASRNIVLALLLRR
jgi:flagellin